MYSNRNENNKNEGNHYRPATCSTVSRITRNSVTLEARLTPTVSLPTSTVLVPAATLLSLVVVVTLVVVLVSGVTSRCRGGSSRGCRRDSSTVIGSSIVVVVTSSGSSVTGSSSSVVGRIAIATEGVRTTATTGGEVNAVIKRTVLSDSNKSGRVVRICVHGAQTVVTGGETIGDRLRYDSVDSATVDTLEKCEDGGV